MSSYVVYGIPNCDTVKKTLVWLSKKNILFTFHNYKQEGITKTQLKKWIQQVGIDAIFNKKSATWRSLGAAGQASLSTTADMISLMQEQTSIIKRPIIEKNGEIIVTGFSEAAYAQLF